MPPDTVHSLVRTPLRHRSRKVTVWQRAAATFTKDEVPAYLRDAYGPFITGHYRGELSLSAALTSILTVHNESGNIWSHLLGLLLMLGLLLAHLCKPPPHACAAPKWPHLLYLVGTMYVLATSTIAHVLCCMGRKVYFRVWKFDYTAIAIVMWTMYVPWCWYVFGCPSTAVPLMYVVPSGALALACVSIGLSDAFQDPTYHALQPVGFCLLGLFGMAPVIHACVLFWGSSEPVRRAVGLTVLQLTCNGLGAALFSMRLPERWFPGPLSDVLGHSHFIMHVLVVASFVAYHFAVLSLWEWRCDAWACLCSEEIRRKRRLL